MYIIYGIFLEELEIWSAKYQILISLLPDKNYGITIKKDFVELYSSGNEDLMDLLKNALDYIYRINRTPMKDRKTISQNPNF